MKGLVLFACLVCVPAAAKTAPEMHTAKVISQEVGTYNGGTAVMPMGGGLIGVPITQRSNVIVLETTHYRVTLSESPRDRNGIILTINSTVQFYHDGNWVVITDSAGKKHKFGTIHAEQIAE